MFYSDGEGVNGNCYSEEMEFGGEYASVKGNGKGKFHYDRLYYHRNLFAINEPHSILHETPKAILFEVPEGQFWVPKKLLMGSRTKVHKSFTRKYL